jgi:hypothetical protein
MAVRAILEMRVDTVTTTVGDAREPERPDGEAGIVAGCEECSEARDLNGGERRAPHPYIGKCWRCGMRTSPPVRMDGCPVRVLSEREKRLRAVCGSWLKEGGPAMAGMNHVEGEDERYRGIRTSWRRRSRWREGRIFPYDATRAASDPFYLSLLRSQSFDLI